MDEHAQEHAAHIIPNGVFYKVWIALVVLTAITASASVWFPGTVGISVAIVVTPLKAALVLAFFMHLKYENPLYKAMFGSTLLILLVFMGLTYLDYIYR